MKLNKMCIALVVITFLSPLFASDDDRIQFIRSEYKKINDLFLDKKNRDLYVGLCEIRGPLRSIMGIPQRRMLFYWENFKPYPEKADSETNNDMRIRKSESYYGNVFDGNSLVTYQEFLFSADGKVLFFYTKHGMGNLSRISECAWEKEARYYFHGDRLIRFTGGGKTIDNPAGDLLKQGREILEHGKIMMRIGKTLNENPHAMISIN